LTKLILTGTMPSIELSIPELKYLAKMNGENIFVMQMMARKNRTVFPDLPIAERIQSKFAAVLPEGLPDPFAGMTSIQSPIKAVKKELSKAGRKKP